MAGKLEYIIFICKAVTKAVVECEDRSGPGAPQFPHNPQFLYSHQHPLYLTSIPATPQQQATKKREQPLQPSPNLTHITLTRAS